LQTKTKHPYVQINPKVCNGSPVISGTRIRIVDIAVEYEYMGYSPADIICAHPHLRPEQVHDALSYYYEHRDEIDKKIKEDEVLVLPPNLPKGQRVDGSHHKWGKEAFLPSGEATFGAV
jgi:uncharacterized protein (DUF433 family)